jgi:hypothetical protein
MIPGTSSLLRLAVAVGGGVLAMRFFGGGLDSVYLAMAAGLVVLACGTALPIALGSWRRR